MDFKPPRPPKRVHISMDLKRETLRVVREGFGGIWSSPALGAQVQVLDGTGSRITLTRVVAVGLLAGGLRKGTGHASVVVIGRDGHTVMIKVKPKGDNIQQLLSWAFEFTAWNETMHRGLGLPYPPLMAAPQA